MNTRLVLGVTVLAAVLAAGCHKEVSEPDKPMAGTTGPGTSQSTPPKGPDSGGVGKAQDSMSGDNTNTGTPADKAAAANAAPPAGTPPATGSSNP